MDCNKVDAFCQYVLQFFFIFRQIFAKVFTFSNFYGIVNTNYIISEDLYDKKESIC